MPDMSTLTRPPEEFWACTEDDITSSCILWTGSLRGRDDRLYGKWYDNGRTLIASRVAYEIEYGPIPDGMLVLHRCDVALCVLPEHLFLGTHADNAKDRVSKGRSGTKHRNPRLSDDDVLSIRASEEPTYVLMERFQVSRPYISRLRSGLRRKAVV